MSCRNRALFAPLIGIAILLAGQLVSAAEKPNVLFIAIDDLNDWVGPLGGHPQVQTPHMDALAARGVTFTNAHCQAPLCNPSRISFLLSRRPSSTGIYALNTRFRETPHLKGATTIFQHFQTHGYETYSVGKIFHNGYYLTKMGLYENEVDHFGPPQSPRPSPKEKLSGTHPIDGKIVDWGVFDHDMTERCDWKTADWTIERLKTRTSEKPFFMACGFYLPHVPIYATQKWHDLYPLDSLILPEIREDDREDCSPFSWFLTWRDPYPKTDWLTANGQLAQLVQSYLATTSFTDAQVGRVLAALEDSGEMENTVIVLFSDHGFHCGEKGVSGKHTLWEESTRVPLIFAGSGIPEGSTSWEAVELLDLYPTLAELCGLPEPENAEGLSLLPQLKDGATPRDQPAICTASPNCHSARDERWRLIEYADGSRELYDCVEDPGEFRNLIGDPSYEEIVAELEKWLPTVNMPAVEGSLSKMVSRRDDGWYYEDVRIDEAELP